MQLQAAAPALFLLIHVLVEPKALLGQECFLPEFTVEEVLGERFSLSSNGTVLPSSTRNVYAKSWGCRGRTSDIAGASEPL